MKTTSKQQNGQATTPMGSQGKALPKDCVLYNRKILEMDAFVCTPQNLLLSPI